jgi:xanthine dehydrogenase YagR molybdenum-binding subunit
MNSNQTISQIHGGLVQGLSYALYEDRLLDPIAGRMLNTNLDMYKTAGSREMPEIEVKLLDCYIGQSSTDASGIGEAAGVVAMPAAIGNAFYNATGKRIRQIPMTPARVLAALNTPPQGSETA